MLVLWDARPGMVAKAWLFFWATVVGVLVAGTVAAQSDQPACFGETPTILGTPGNDHLRGTSGPDVIQALGGNDVVHGGGGDDLICGDTGHDKLFGGKGNDTLHKESGGGLFVGGPGDDRLFGNLGDDRMYGGPGSDYMLGGNGDEEDVHPGRDRLYGGPGNDWLEGNQGDDRVYGGTGNDRILGGSGDDRLFGGPGDDFLDGGPGADVLDGGPGDDTLVDEPPPPPPPPPNATLEQLIDLNSRTGIRDWAASRTIATIDSEVAALDQSHRDRLPEVILDTNATGESRDKMLRVMHRALAVPELGFYTEIWSYTYIELVPPGFFGGCNRVMLDPNAWGGLSDQDAYNVFMHENFHSFNCVNGGPAGALNEGSAIWILKAPYDQPLIPGESFAEATYGTKLYYRDINNQPDYPLEAAANPTQKLIDVYTYMSAHDPSQLPWNSTARLQACFGRYFVDLDRDVDFFNVWLPEVKERTDLMLADPACAPL